MIRNMRIAFVIHSLEAGGAERVASTIVNGWVEAGDRVTLVTLESVDKDFYRLDPRVERVSLNATGRSRSGVAFIANNWRRVKMLRSTLRAADFDVIVSFIDKTNVLTLLGTLGLGLPVIVSEHIDPRRHSVGLLTAILRRMLYPLARAVIVLTPGIAEWARLVAREEAIRVIPNPIAEQFLDNEAAVRDCVSHAVVGMGRLLPQKGFDRLLAAFAKCAEKHSEWTLRIVGEGTERERLLESALELGIGHRVRLDSVTSNPEKVFRDSDIFVLSSRYEGLPMVLLEAMACGLPVISFDCASGPKEIIRDGVDGILVPPDDVVALAGAMDRLMSDPEERRRLAARAPEVRTRFGIRQVMAMWNEVLAEAAGVNGSNGVVDALTRCAANERERNVSSKAAG